MVDAETSARQTTITTAFCQPLHTAVETPTEVQEAEHWAGLRWFADKTVAEELLEPVTHCQNLNSQECLSTMWECLLHYASKCHVSWVEQTHAQFELGDDASC